MTQMPTIHLTGPIATACVIDAGQWRIEPAVGNPEIEVQNPPPGGPSAASEPQRAELARLLEILNGIADGLHQLHEQTLARNRAEIARLALEIARRILRYKVDQGDYEIQAIVEEALKRAPTRQNVVVRLNPEDVSRCQQLQKANPQSPFAELELTADWNIGRGECLVETPKGIVQSFIEEHLEHISEALQKVE
jgi:flagellar assembly protein FliH